MMRNATRSHPDNRTAAGFLKEESGSVTIFALAGFAMCLVVAGLAFDVGRVMSIHTQASSYADQVALAAASELDSRFDLDQPNNDNALIRAVNSATGLGDGQRITMGGDGNLRIASLRFFSTIAPPPGTNPVARSPWRGDRLTATWKPSDSPAGPWTFASGYTFKTATLESRFVLVDLQTVNEPYTLLPLAGLFGGASQKGAQLAPQAMAGFERRMCNITPIMVCNPKDINTRPGPAFDPSDRVNYTFKLQGRRRSGETNPWSFRVYSFLQTADDDARALRRRIEDDDPNTVCYGKQSPVLSSPNADNEDPDNNPRIQIGQGWNVRWSQDDGRRREFPVAVVNCMDNLAALRAGRSVPIIGYAQAQLRRPPSGQNRAVDLNDPDHDDEITLRSLGMVSDGISPEHRREYSVLVR